MFYLFTTENKFKLLFTTLIKHNLTREITEVISFNTKTGLLLPYLSNLIFCSSLNKTFVN